MLHFTLTAGSGAKLDKSGLLGMPQPTFTIATDVTTTTDTRTVQSVTTAVKTSTRTTTPKLTTASPSNNTDPCKPYKDNVYFPVPGNCHSFYLCSFGTTYTFQCPGSTVFFPSKNICDNNEGRMTC